MSTSDEQFLSIGAIAKRSGVKASALRFYESLGLIESVRSESSHRHFHRSTLRRIAHIVFAQRVGFQLEEIAVQLKGLNGKNAPNKDDWEELWSIWVQRVDERIAELTTLRASLDDCIGCGCLSLKACCIYNHEDRMAKKGPGPRRWLGDKMRAIPIVEDRDRT